MVETTENGRYYYRNQQNQIELALANAIKAAAACVQIADINPRYNSRTQNGWVDALKGEMPKREDFCIFVSERGYMVIALWYYRKLSKKDKRLIDRAYEYKFIPEGKNG